MNFVKIFISSGVAFVFAILVAVLIETFGGAIGSVIGTLPFTIIPAAFIIITEQTKTVDERVESLMACLYGMLSTDLLFLPSWRAIPPRLPRKWSNGLKASVTTVLSLLIWFIGAGLMLFLKSVVTKLEMSIWSFGVSILVFTALCAGSICWRLPPTPAGKNKVGLSVHFIRGISAAIAIFISGVLSQTSLGVLAGAMITFPVIFLTTLVSVSLTQGPEVATGAIGPMTLGGQSYGLKRFLNIVSAGMVSGVAFSSPSSICIRFGAVF